jgi:hypothetical protein
LYRPLLPALLLNWWAWHFHIPQNAVDVGSRCMANLLTFPLVGVAPWVKDCFLCIVEICFIHISHQICLKGYCVWVQEMPNTLPSTETSLCLGCFACTQANENENEALPSHKLCCSLKDNPIDFFYLLAMSLECVAKIMTESRTNTMVTSNVFECTISEICQIRAPELCKSSTSSH